MAECKDDDALNDSSSDHDDKSIVHLNSKDTIEGTVFSKSWVFTLLVRLVKLIDHSKSLPEPAHTSDDQIHDTRSPSHSEDNSLGESDSTAPNRLELDVSVVKCFNDNTAEYEHSTAQTTIEILLDEESLENELCKLWDASTNVNVSLFLHEYNVVELLMGSIVRSNSSRLTEICVGITGNMVCNQQISREAIGTVSSQNFFISLLNHHDSSVLMECIRLISTCLSHPQEQNAWLATLQASPSILGDIIFILNNSTNEDLLKTLSVMLDKLLDLEEALCLKWSCQQFVIALCEASEQCRLYAIDVSCTLVLILQSLTTTKEGVETIVSNHECVGGHLVSFLQSVSVYYEGWEADDNNRRGLMAGLSLCKCLLVNEASSFKNTIKDVVDFIHKLSVGTVHAGTSENEPCWIAANGCGVDSEWQIADDSDNAFITDGIRSLANDVIIIVTKD